MKALGRADIPLHCIAQIIFFLPPYLGLEGVQVVPTLQWAP